MSKTIGMRSGRVSQRWLLESIQRGEPFVYVILTREGAIKIGYSANLMDRKKSGIMFGGTEKFLAFAPGDVGDEQEIHSSLTDHRIHGTQEYYYPTPEILPTVNQMRDWMGLPHLRRKDLPRLAACTFHRRVMERQG